MTPRVDIPTPAGLLRTVRELVVDADEALLCVAFANEAGVTGWCVGSARNRTE